MTKGPITILTEAYERKHAGEDTAAFQLFRQAFEMSTECSAHPSRALAEYYEEGRVVPRDMALAFKYYKIAAEGHIADAQAKVAEYLSSGEHVPQNLTEAAEWRERERAQRKRDAQPILTLADSIKQEIARKAREKN